MPGTGSSPGWRTCPITDGRTVYLTDNGDTLYAVDSESGAERWRAVRITGFERRQILGRV